MSLRLPLLAAAFFLVSCAAEPSETPPASPPPPVDATALTGIRGALLSVTPAVLDGPDEGAEREDVAGVKWGFSPLELQVFRATAVEFSVNAGLDGRPGASCRWNFGDGSPSGQGCQISHTFHGGQADQVVTLHVSEGAWSTSSTQTIPLERLPVEAKTTQKGTDEAPKESLGIPSPPKAGPGSLRFALVADSAAKGGVHEDVQRGMSQLAKLVRPDLVIHVGGMVGAQADQGPWADLQAGITDPLARASIPWVAALSTADRAAGAKVPKTPLQFIDGAHYPERYSFTSHGAFFLVFGAAKDGVSEDTLRWMRDQLGEARIYEARYVVSHLPLHKFTGRHVGSLDKRFRLYEIFLRSRVTAFFSAGYRVYFKGRYGALPVVSVGALAAPGGTLSGVDFEQPSSFVVVDQIQGVPERIFSVTGPGFHSTFDESTLPESVEVYTR